MARQTSAPRATALRTLPATKQQWCRLASVHDDRVKIRLDLSFGNRVALTIASAGTGFNCGRFATGFGSKLSAVRGHASSDQPLLVDITGYMTPRGPPRTVARPSTGDRWVPDLVLQCPQ